MTIPRHNTAQDVSGSAPRRVPFDTDGIFARTNLSVSILHAMLHLVPGFGGGLAVLLLSSVSPVLGAAALLPAWLLIGRSMRAAENLVHDGSHYNWVRRSKPLNDSVVDSLVGASVGVSVKRYRGPHMRHHGRFGSDADPCRERTKMAGVLLVNEPSLWRRLHSAVKSIWSIRSEFYTSQIAAVERVSWSQVGRTAIWHGAITAAPLFVFYGATVGALWWITLVAVPYLSVLPIIRAIAEGDEHDYSKSPDQLSSSFTVQGPHGWFFHPAGDAYHAAHHTQMTVPAWRIRRFHEHLLEHDERYAVHLRNQFAPAKGSCSSA